MNTSLRNARCSSPTSHHEYLHLISWLSWLLLLLFVVFTNALAETQCGGGEYKFDFDLVLIGGKDRLPPGQPFPADLRALLKPVAGGNSTHPALAAVPRIGIATSATAGGNGTAPTYVWPTWSARMLDQKCGLLGWMSGHKPAPRDVAENLSARLDENELKVPGDIVLPDHVVGNEDKLAQSLSGFRKQDSTPTLILFFSADTGSAEGGSIELGGSRYPVISGVTRAQSDIKKFLSENDRGNGPSRVILVLMDNSIPGNVRPVAISPPPFDDKDRKELPPRQPITKPPVTNPDSSGKFILRFSGSNTLGAKLIPELARGYLENRYADKKPKVTIIDGPPNARGEIVARQVTAVLADKTSVSITVQAHGSATAFKEDPNNGIRGVGLQGGFVDIGMSSRKIKPDELQLLEGAGLGKVGQFGPRQGDGGEHVIAMDGIAVIVHPVNPMDAQISLEDIRKIYSGQITRWEQLPGANGMTGEIRPLRRDNLSGTYDFFCEKVMEARAKRGSTDPTPEPLSAATEAFEDSNALVQRVTADRQAIGFVGVAYVGGSKPLAIKRTRADLPASAVLPDVEPVRDGTYPLARPLYLYTKNPAPEAASDFIRFALGDDGQRIVAQDGHSVHIVGSPVELPGQVTKDSTPPPPVPNVVLRLHGSNSIGGRLAGELAQQFMRERQVLQPEVQYGPVTETKEGKARDVYIIGDIDHDGRKVAIEIRPHGSSTAFSALREGRCEIGLASRKIRPVEYTEIDPDSRQSLRDILGDLTVSDRSAVGAENTIGYDGIAVMVNVANPIEEIDLRTLRDIYTGGRTSWEKGRRKINAYARDPRSGTYQFFKERVFPDGELAPGIPNQYEDGQKLAAAVADDPAAIGFVALPDAKGVKVLNLRERNSLPVAPNAQTIRSGTYPLTRPLYMYLARGMATKGTVTPQSLRLAEEFMKFVQSGSGQRIVEDDGFVRADIVPPCPVAGERTPWVVPFYIYFDTAKDQPTPQSRQDVAVWLTDAFRQTPECRTWSFRLTGYTDDVGGAEYNLNLSQRRALQVKRYLESQRYNVKSYEGLGMTRFIGDNGTEEGKRRNRRVEMVLEPPQ